MIWGFKRGWVVAVGFGGRVGVGGGGGLEGRGLDIFLM